MLDSHTLFSLGIILLAVGLTLQAGATGAVKAIKMSAKLISGQQRADDGRVRNPADYPRSAQGGPSDNAA